jgi:hypothetical protein
MGKAELDPKSGRLSIRSVFYCYGEASNAGLAAALAEDMEAHWNAPKATVRIGGNWYSVVFSITAIHEPLLRPDSVWYNTDPALNFFRIEEFSSQHVSFVDGLGSNSGYFKVDNLLDHSTTAAHEYGHTLGLEHPGTLDIRGQGQPGIMYPRGTICDPEFQYDPAAEPLQPGGTLNPFTRKVLQADIDDLKLSKLFRDGNREAVLGEFTNCWHEKHQPETGS